MMRRLRRMLFERAGQPADSASPKIAIVGGLRCGTNYLKYLLERNYVVSADFNSFGWKHSGIPVLGQNSRLAYPDVPLAYIVKNPYAFVASLHRYHRRKATHGDRISVSGNDGFDAFLTGSVVISDSQLAGSPQMRFPNPLQYWNFLYWNLETLDTSRFSAVGFNYEDLIADPDQVRGVEAVAKLQRRSIELATPRNQMRRLGESAGLPATGGYESVESFDPSYYKEKRYLEHYTPEQLAFIRSEVSEWLMQRRGYQLI